MKFVTITNQRSGSSLFHRLLDSHPDILALQEEMRDAKTIGRKTMFKRLDSIYAKENEFKTVGFKLQHNHITRDLIEYIVDNNVKVIQLIRRDVLETALWFRHHVEGDVEGGGGVPLKVNGKVKAKIPTVIDYMQKLHKWINHYKDFADFTVYYEDICGDKDTDTFYDTNKKRDLMHFLEVMDCYLTKGENMPKNTRGKSENIVENWGTLLKEIDKNNIKKHV